MKARNHIWIGIFAAVCMLVLILDSKTALDGATEGVKLCIYTIIPSLFPFIVLSVIINNALFGKPIKLLRPVSKLCGIPAGAESLLLLGILGGYPVGAQSIFQAYKKGQINNNDACHMLSFCNNAGPAFIFGIVAALFSSPAVAWVIWGLHILSALLVGVCFQNKTVRTCEVKQCEPLRITKALDQGIRVTAAICGWVILFRIILSICNRWFLWILPDEIRLIFYGFLELSNGCYTLKYADSEGLRFILSSVFLAAGGFCVAMQTASVARELGIRTYLRGKVLQCCFTFIMAAIAQTFLFSNNNAHEIPCYMFIFTIIVSITIIAPQYSKKLVAISQAMMYNKKKSQMLR